MLAEFLRDVRGRFDNELNEKTLSLRGCQSFEDLRRAQGYLDGVARARVMFDEAVRQWKEDVDDA